MLRLRSNLGSLSLGLIAAVACLLSAPCQAEKGTGSVRLEYQYIRTGVFDSSIGEIDIGNTDAHVFFLSGQYALTDRWTLTASLPYIKKRHRGALPHVPAVDLTEYPQADQSLLDNGEFHSDWQDLYLGASYLAKDGWLSLRPFISVGVPTNDYPFYGHAAVGRNLWHVPVGVAFEIHPHFSDITFGGSLAYVFTEKTLGVNVSHWLLNLELGYYLTPRFVPKLILSAKNAPGGLEFPDDFNLDALNDEAWYVHDRTAKHNFINGGLAFDWFINDDYMLSGSAITMVLPDQVNEVEYGVSIAISKFFR